LSNEMAQNVGSLIGGMVKDAFDQPYEIKELSFDLVWNLGIPCVLLLLALSILGYTCKEMIQSFYYEEETKFDLILKIILSIALVLSTLLVLIKFGHLLFLNFVVAFVVLFTFGLIFLGFSSLFANERTN
jgi:hypothetical protein